MVDVYINDVVTEEEIKKWKPNNRILINSPTGSGKSTFIRRNLYQYCKTNDKKILILSNRVALKEQVISELIADGLVPKKPITAENIDLPYQIDDKNSIISVKNYQSIEKRFEYKIPFSEIFRHYDFVVFDEAHYLLNDSFNRKTDYLLELLYPQNLDKIFIFLTATPDGIKTLTEFDSEYGEYTIPKNYNYIKSITFYKSEKALEYILCNIPQNEKLIFFGTCEKSYELSKVIPDSAFYCSQHNKEWSKYSNKDIFYEIVEDKTFKSCKNLFSTSVLDNGVSLEDDLNIDPRPLKHIIIEQPDFTTFLQCLGRKKVKSGETVKVYIKHYSNSELNRFLAGINYSLNTIQKNKELGKDKFLETYKRTNFDDIIYNDGTINIAKQADYEYRKTIYEKMINQSYGTFICKQLNFPTKCAEVIDDDIEASLVQHLLATYENQLQTKDAQKEFIRLFFENIYSPKKTWSRGKSLHTINAILDELKTGYVVLSKKVMIDGERQQVWIVEKGRMK